MCIRDRVNEVFTIAVICAGAAALICAAACLIFPETAAGFLGAEGEILPLAAAYIRGLGAGALPIIISQVLMAFTKTDGSPRLGLYSIIVMTVINITLDFCNVLFFHLGMFGMAMATSISYFAAVFICLIHFFKPVNSLRFVRVKNPFRELCTDVYKRQGQSLVVWAIAEGTEAAARIDESLMGYTGL